MIQRKQTLWLLLAALLTAGVLYFDVYRADVLRDTAVITDHLTVAAHFPSLLTAILAILLPLGAIFMFKDRKRQRGLTLGSIFVTLGFIGVNLMRISNYNHQVPAPQNGMYYVGSILPVVSIIFLILAVRGIRKDEKLVRSLDRLR